MSNHNNQQQLLQLDNNHNRNQTIMTNSNSNIYLSPHLIFHHLKEPIDSTQDEARRLLREHRTFSHGQQPQQQQQPLLAVLADIQLHGRGTQGRLWERGTTTTLSTAAAEQSDGNLYLTVCVPVDRIPIPTWTLLPLHIGALVAERVTRLLAACHPNSNNNNSPDPTPASAKVTVKWPNDVLINHHKISGTLIENETIPRSHQDDQQGHPQQQLSWLLVGIGVNIASAPRNLSQSPGKQVRPAGCLADFCPAADLSTTMTALALGQDLAHALADWVFHAVDQKDNNNIAPQREEQRIREQWLSYAEFGQEYELRGRTVDEEQGGYEGERVVTVGLETDGQLRVRGRDGRERTLVADYLF